MTSGRHRQFALHSADDLAEVGRDQVAVPHAGRQGQADVVPDEHDRSAQLDAGANDQIAEVTPAEASLALEDDPGLALHRGALTRS